MEETTEDSLPGKILDLMGVAFIIGAFAIAAYNYKNLPDSIPVHYNFEGIADRYADKKSIFISPILGAIVLLILSALTYLPDTIKRYPVKITEQNKEVQKALAYNLLRYLKIEISFMFMTMTFDSAKSAINGTNTLSIVFFLPLILIFGTIIWFLVLAIKNK